MESDDCPRELDRRVAEEIFGLIVFSTNEETSMFDDEASWNPGLECYTVESWWANKTGEDPDAEDYLEEYATFQGMAKVIDRLNRRGIYLNINTHSGNVFAFNEHGAQLAWRNNLGGVYGIPETVCSTGIAAIEKLKEFA